MSLSVASALIIFVLSSVSCMTSDKNPDAVSLGISKHFANGNEYAKDGLLREAIEEYKKAIKSEPDNASARRNLGIVFIRSGSYESAVQALEQVIGKFENDFEANFYLAEGYRGISKYSEAIYRYQKSLRINENEPKAMKALAWSYFKISQYAEANEIARELYKTSPKDGQVAIILARTLVKLRVPKKALAIIKAGKQGAEKDSLAYFNSVEGDIYLSIGECNKAMELYRLALKEQPLLAGSLLGLGQCYFEQGNKEKAITYIERALRIRPKLTEALYTLAKIYEPTNKKLALRYYGRFRKQAARDPEFVGKLSEVKQKMSALRKQSSSRLN